MIVSIRIPQMGEGLQEALLVEFIKQAGDMVQRDEPLYVMETDKATTDVESPYSGKLIAWTAVAGTVLPIGAEVGKMEVDDGVKPMPSGHAPASDAPTPLEHDPSASNAALTDARTKPRVFIPPKTRKQLKDLGLLEIADQIPARGLKLMPSDVDAYVAAQQLDRSQTSATTEYELQPLPKSQISLNFRLTRSAQTVVPVTLIADIDWTAVLAIRQSQGADGGPTGFAMACWAIVQAMRQHSKFRSSLNAEGTALKVFRDVNLGVAVALPGDEMVTAVVERADQLSPDQFFAAYAASVKLAREGRDQATEATTLIVSNIGKVGMRVGVPAIVAPAVATLAIGEVFQQPIPHGDSFQFRPTVTATLSFDHRIANGVGAANFLNDVRYHIQQLQMCLSLPLSWATTGNR